MRPHHGRKEVHPGRWKGMESKNNGTEATDALSTKEWKYSNPNGISEGQEEDPSTREELAQANNKYADSDIKSSNNAETKEESFNRRS